MNDQTTEEFKALSEAIQLCCATRAGVVDTGFLCESVAVLNPEEPIFVEPAIPVRDIMIRLRENKSGCVVILDGNQRVQGIFSERDFVLKVFDVPGALEQPIGEFMTKEPFCVQPTDTVAFALNLMSQGGFRNLPVIDEEGRAIGLLSVKQFVDHLSDKVMTDLLEFKG